MTFCFGAVLGLVCPLMFYFQNIILGLVLNWNSVRGDYRQMWKQLFQMTAYQSVIITDHTLFTNGIPWGMSKWWKWIPLTIISYLCYLLLPVLLFTALLCFETHLIICRPLSTVPFLLDNRAPLAHNFELSDLYRKRQAYASEILDWAGNDGLWRRSGLIEPRNGLLWDAMSTKQPYMPLDDITDFIAQFNYVGYHDICNYPQRKDVHKIDYADKETDFFYLYPGYNTHNSSG